VTVGLRYGLGRSERPAAAAAAAPQPPPRPASSAAPRPAPPPRRPPVSSGSAPVQAFSVREFIRPTFRSSAVLGPDAQNVVRKRNLCQVGSDAGCHVGPPNSSGSTVQPRLSEPPCEVRGRPMFIGRVVLQCPRCEVRWKGGNNRPHLGDGVKGTAERRATSRKKRTALATEFRGPLNRRGSFLLELSSPWC